MSVSSEYKDFVIDVLSSFGDVQVRSMFGGGGVYHQGIMFGLIADETLFLKADDTNIPDFESEGMGPFLYEGKSGKPISMSYWQVPDYLYENSDEMKSWAEKAYNIALSTKKPKPKKRK